MLLFIDNIGVLIYEINLKEEKTEVIPYSSAIKVLNHIHNKIIERATSKPVYRKELIKWFSYFLKKKK